MTRPFTKAPTGFTLVELLVAVAIIAILAAIAVPNFLEAQTRAKVSRVKSDLRAISVALESYCVDYGRYSGPLRVPGRPRTFLQYVLELTTPISYLSTVQLTDPFKPAWKAFDSRPAPRAVPAPPDFIASYSYYNWAGAWGEHEQRASHYPMFPCYVLTSVGPDRDSDNPQWLAAWIRRGDPDLIADGFDKIYDPTNGTRSNGDIVRFCGESGVNIGN